MRPTQFHSQPPLSNKSWISTWRCGYTIGTLWHLYLYSFFQCREGLVQVLLSCLSELLTLHLLLCNLLTVSSLASLHPASAAQSLLGIHHTASEHHKLGLRLLQFNCHGFYLLPRLDQLAETTAQLVSSVTDLLTLAI